MLLNNSICSVYLIPAIALSLIQGNLSAGELTGRIITEKASTEEPIFTPVVWIEGAKSDALPVDNTVITHAGGRLQPPVSIGYVGNEFVLRNDDPAFHNTHLYLHLDYQKEASQRPLHYGATLYNVPLPIQGKEIRKSIKPYHRYREETGFIEVVCNPHPAEKAYVLVFDHPFCAIADKNGSFTIEGIPEGQYPVLVFYQGKVHKLAEVDVSENERTAVDLNLN